MFSENNPLNTTQKYSSWLQTDSIRCLLTVDSILTPCCLSPHDDYLFCRTLGQCSPLGSCSIDITSVFGSEHHHHTYPSPINQFPNIGQNYINFPQFPWTVNPFYHWASGSILKKSVPFKSQNSYSRIKEEGNIEDVDGNGSPHHYQFHSAPPQGTLPTLPANDGSLPKYLPTGCAYVHQHQVVSLIREWDALIFRRQE